MPVAVGEQAIVADAVEALGQDVHQEAADELVGGQRHGLGSARSIESLYLNVTPLWLASRRRWLEMATR
jgi:hypothetical protein